jgi:hypothetical protein
MKLKAIILSFIMFLMCLPGNMTNAQTAPEAATHVLTENFENAKENEDGSYSYGGAYTINYTKASGYKSYCIGKEDDNDRI